MHHAIKSLSHFALNAQRTTAEVPRRSQHIVTPNKQNMCNMVPHTVAKLVKTIQIARFYCGLSIVNRDL